MYWTGWSHTLAPCGRGKSIGGVVSSPRPLWERVQSCLNRQAKATNAGEG